MSALTIRKADISDTDHIINLLTDYRTFYRLDTNLNELTSFVKARIQNAESVILLAFAGRKAVGIAQLYPCFTTLGLGKLWILNDLFVSDTQRSQGIGKALLDETIRFAKKDGAKRVDLKTEHDNFSAKTFYEKYGFIRDETYVHYRFHI